MNQKKYIGINNISNSKRKKIKNLTRLGIPDNLRGYVWQLFADIKSIKIPNKYSELLSLSKNNTVLRNNNNINDILKDLSRTSHSTFFKVKMGLGQSCLFNVLSTFSVQSEIGYVQGMSIIAASLLSYMNEESAYWMMFSLMDKYKMKGFFQPEFPELNKAYYKLLNLMKDIIPDIYKTLLKWKIYPNYYASQWFITLFLLTVNHDVYLRIFDVFLLERNHKILYRVSLALLKLNEDKINSAKSFDELMTLFGNLGRNITVEMLFKELFKIKFPKYLLEEYDKHYDKIKETNSRDEFIEQLEN